MMTICGRSGHSKSIHIWSPWKGGIRMKYNALGRVLQGVIAVLTFAAVAKADSPVDIGSRREIFVDRHLIGRLDGTRQQLHSPQSAGKVMAFDCPWEGPHSAYVSVIRSEDKYQLYYRGAPKFGPDGNTNEVTCYAESSDGIHWTKPELDLFDVMGSKKNNVILANDAPFSHNLSPFLDTRPGVPADEKYKALAGVDSKSGLVAFVSSDGIRWRKWRTEPVFNHQDAHVFDSQNVAFWSESEQCYVLYYRVFVNNIRTVARTTSKDFVNWSRQTLMTYSTAAPTEKEQLYTNQTEPYFRAPHIYVALAARFMPGRVALTPEQLKHMGVAEGNWLGDDCSDAVLMSTRGGTVYDRTFPHALVRPGNDKLSWLSRSNYPARGVVQTGPEEMSMYVQRHEGLPSHYLERLTFRLDGFSSVSASHERGEMTTKPLRFTGGTLVVNYSTSAAGGIRVEIQDEAGEPIKGYSLSDCTELIGDEIDRTVDWAGKRSVIELAGETVRLRFQVKEADLYSIHFKAPETDAAP